MPEADRISFLGHSTVELRLDGVTFLTDPLLRRRVGPLVRRPPHVDPGSLAPDAVLISHLDRDHLDLPSLRALGGDPRLVVPRGAAAFARRHGFEAVIELARGEATNVDGVTVTAVPTVHDGWRAPFGPRADTVGYVIEGSRRIYFAGDTDLFDEMADLAPLDVALVPVAGWGPTVGEGHLDPSRAVKALELLRPRMAVPIHWGGLHPVGLRRLMRRNLIDAPRNFAREASRAVPEVNVLVLEPGESLDLAASPTSGENNVG